MHATSVGVSAGLHIIFFTANIIQLQTEIGLWYVGVAPPPLLFWGVWGCGGCKQAPPHNLFSQKKLRIFKIGKFPFFVFCLIIIFGLWFDFCVCKEFSINPPPPTFIVHRPIGHMAHLNNSTRMSSNI